MNSNFEWDTTKAERNYKNHMENKITHADDMLPEYNFSGGVRGKHYRAYQQGNTVTIHNADGTQTVQHFDTVTLIYR